MYFYVLPINIETMVNDDEPTVTYDVKIRQASPSQQQPQRKDRQTSPPQQKFQSLRQQTSPSQQQPQRKTNI